MKKKSLLALLLTVAMVSGLFTGCGNGGKTETTAAATEAAKETAGETEAATAADDATTAAAETSAAETEGQAAAGSVNTVILKEADDKMINTYTVIAVDPEAPFTDENGNAVSDVAVNTAGADALIQFLLSEEGKTAAAEFGQEDPGRMRTRTPIRSMIRPRIQSLWMRRRDRKLWTVPASPGRMCGIPWKRIMRTAEGCCAKWERETGSLQT